VCFLSSKAFGQFGDIFDFGKNKIQYKASFHDVGHAWFDDDFSFDDIDTAYGFGIRLNVGAFFLLR